MDRGWLGRFVAALAGCFLAISHAGTVDLTEGFDDITDLPSKGWSL